MLGEGLQRNREDAAKQSCMPDGTPAMIRCTNLILHAALSISVPGRFDAHWWSPLTTPFESVPIPSISMSTRSP
jgi:hypothetical protein